MTLTLPANRSRGHSILGLDRLTSRAQMDREPELKIIQRASAKQVIASAGVSDPAFTVAREDFLGPGPWQIVRWGVRREGAQPKPLRDGQKAPEKSPKAAGAGISITAIPNDPRGSVIFFHVALHLVGLIGEVDGPDPQLFVDLRLYDGLRQRATVPRQVAKVVRILHDPSSQNY
jgi:hypothetical protein